MEFILNRIGVHPRQFMAEGQAPSNFPEVTRKLVEWGATSVSVTPDMLGKTRKIVADVERELASA